MGLTMLAFDCDAAVGWAESNPRSVPADQRIRTVAFQNDNVVFLTGTMGVSTMIVFGDDERIATVAMGDFAIVAGGARSEQTLSLHQTARARRCDEHERRHFAAGL